MLPQTAGPAGTPSRGAEPVAESWSQWRQQRAAQAGGSSGGRQQSGPLLEGTDRTAVPCFTYITSPVDRYVGLRLVLKARAAEAALSRQTFLLQRHQ